MGMARVKRTTENIRAADNIKEQYTVFGGNGVPRYDSSHVEDLQT